MFRGRSKKSLILFVIIFSIISVKQINPGIIADIKNKASDLLDKLSDARKKATDALFMNKVKDEFNKSNPYKDKQAQIRQSKELSSDEVRVISKRLEVNNKNLEKIIGKPVGNNNLKIAIAASGGGYRALIATLGYLNGMQSIKLLDSVTYASGLSGGAWAIATWISSGKNIQEFMQMTKNNFAENKRLGDLSVPHVENSQMKNVISNLLDSFVFDLPLTSVNLWGAAIGDNVLNPLQNRHKLKLSEQQKEVSAGNKPFPIYTAVEPIKSSYYNWFEFNPYEIGDMSKNIYVPTWAFGRKFLNGKSTYNSPELPLDFYLGVFGSAFTVSPEEIENKLDIRNKLIEFLHDKFSSISIETLDRILNFKGLFDEIEDKNIPIRDVFRKRALPGEVANPELGLQGEKKKNTKLVDGGIEFNLPLPPLLKPERKIDIIFIFDASANFKGAPELKLAEHYARTSNIKFPKIDYSNIDQAINIFGTEDRDTQMPIVIYMPIVNGLLTMSDAEIQNIKLKLNSQDAKLVDKLRKFDPENCVKSGFCSTINFAYSSAEFDLLSQMTYLNTVINKDKIYDAIALAFNKKYGGLK